MVQRRLGWPTRRGLVTGVTALGLALGAGACSTLDKAQSAAIVDGSPIYTTDLAQTTDQFNAYQVAAAKAQGQGQATPISQRDMLGYLVRARFLVPYVQRTGVWKPDAGYAQVLALFPAATATTKDFLVTAYTESNQLLPASATAAISDEISKADIQVSPRYGTFNVSPDAATGSSFTTTVPNWIKPVPRPSAPGQ